MRASFEAKTRKRILRALRETAGNCGKSGNPGSKAVREDKGRTVEREKVEPNVLGESPVDRPNRPGKTCGGGKRWRGQKASFTFFGGRHFH
jgi:hypothetical protein